MTKTEKTVSDTQKIKELVQDIKVAMLTTVSQDDGSLRSRPMMPQVCEDNGVFWFLTSRETTASEDLENEALVNVAFACPDKSKYVSLSGSATLVNDHEKIKSLWSPLDKAWFPDGVNDPNLVLLKFEAHEGSFWDAPAGKMVQFLKIAQAALSGKGYISKESEHGSIQF